MSYKALTTHTSLKWNILMMAILNLSWRQQLVKYRTPILPKRHLQILIQMASYSPSQGCSKFHEVQPFRQLDYC